MSSANGNSPSVVVIIGASAGVGPAAVRAFANLGARIDAEEQGGEALAIPMDVAKSEEVEAAGEAVEKKFGPVDIWVNNAMTTVFSPLKEIEPEEFKPATKVTNLAIAIWTTVGTLWVEGERVRPIVSGFYGEAFAR